MITSVGNPQVKRIVQLNQKAKARREEGVFVAEGLKMFMEAPPFLIEKVFMTETAARREDVREKLKRDSLSFEIVSDPVFSHISDTKTPQGILALVRTPKWKTEDILNRRNPFFVILEDLQDPGNAGTIIRTGEGAGVDAVFLTRGSVDVTNPKVIRSTMGSIFRVPVIYTESVQALMSSFRSRGIRSYAAHLKGRRDYDQTNLTGGIAILIGNEANGLSDRAADEADRLIRIPMLGNVESLNAAMAAGILMYEAARQRRNMH